MHCNGTIELTYTQNPIEIGIETNDLESNHLQLNHEAPFVILQQKNDELA